jgi:hypothetical protein
MKIDRSMSRLIEAIDHAQQCAFAGAARANDRKHFALLNGKADVLDKKTRGRRRQLAANFAAFNYMSGKIHGA